MKLRYVKFRISATCVLACTLCACATNTTSSTFEFREQFDSPQDAVQALASAVKKDDRVQLAAIFGSDNSEIYSSGDETADQNGRKLFTALYNEQNDIETESNGDKTLVLGKMEWPFPVPLAQADDGKWFYDSEIGVDEIVNRRIGQNELNAIAVCRTLAKAEKEYFKLDPDHDKVKEYTAKILSTPGSRDGHFWARQPGESPSPIGPLIATAAAQGYSSDGGPKPYHGYFFRVLTEKNGKSFRSPSGDLTGGFAILASPAKWGVSGIMTFIVGVDGVVYEKNLGAETTSIAASMNSYSLERDWVKIKES